MEIAQILKIVVKVAFAKKRLMYLNNKSEIM